MKIGLVGYQGAGKSTLFEWLTGVAADPAQSHVGQSAMAAVPDDRFPALCKIYQPKKTTHASLELVDAPGLSRDHEGAAQRLALIREAGCLVMVAAAFDGADALADARGLNEDFVLADMEILSGRIDRLRESVKKPRPNREQEQAELVTLERVLAVLDAGRPLADAELNDEQRKSMRAFRLFSEKPRLVIVNLADDQSPDAFTAPSSTGDRVIAAPIGLQRELSRMTPEDRAEFEQEMQAVGPTRDELLREFLAVSGQILYFTAGEKEVRSWLLPQSGSALAAADNIHSDLARGFIRAETMHADDLIRLGSEREVKAQNLLRQEPKDYLVKDGDVLLIRFNV